MDRSSLQGARVWLAHDEKAWVQGEVTSDNGEICIIQTHEGQRKVHTKEVLKSERVVDSTISKIHSNLVDLEAFSEGAILFQIESRYNNNDIYTFVGRILVAINPFKRLDIYTEKSMLKHKRAVRSSAAQQPHVFAVGALAYHNMSQDRQSQSVLISGESGAGKTETTKKVLQYLAFVAGSGAGIEKKILQSNPITEAFGNAKTLRNNNSSRFGKWMKIDFDRSGKILGCEIVNYLLETSRVTQQSKNERNYHIFYMLCKGASSEQQQHYYLQPPEEFDYINKSGCITIENGEHKDDRHEWGAMSTAIQELEWSEEEVDGVMSLVAAVLHLGNVQFIEKSGEDDSQVEDPDCVRRAAKLMGCDFDMTCRVFTEKKMKVTGRSSITMISMSCDQARTARDALAKAMYGKLFDWLIERINHTLRQHGSVLHIGVLDIFGFEVFKTNYFEQLCINYANEKLQQHFNSCIFKAEIAMYESENVPVESIVFVDNQLCLDLIEKKSGSVLAMLDEELVMPKATDATFVSKLHSNFGGKQGADGSGHPHYRKIVQRPNAFVVLHFAGAVEYTSEKCLAKNKDDVVTDLVELMCNSTIPLAASLFQPAGDDEDLTTTQRKKKLKTIAGKFRLQLASLMETLNATEPHFIRCVKPNSAQTSELWEAPLCLRQLKYAGLFEAIRIRKAGYAFRIEHEAFFSRYAICARGQGASPYAKKKKKGEIDEVNYGQKCADLINALPPGLDPSEWIVGRTKVFIRTNKGRNALEGMRTKGILQYVLTLQSFFRDSLAKLRANRELYRKKKEQQEKARKLALARKKREEEEAAAERARQEDARRQKEEEERRERQRREEEERRREDRRKKVAAAVTMQRIVRGKSARNILKRAVMVQTLETALENVDERALERGIEKALKMKDRMGDGMMSSELTAAIKQAQVIRERLCQQRLLKEQLQRATINEDMYGLVRALKTLTRTFPEFERMAEATAARNKLSELKQKKAAEERLRDLVEMGRDISHAVDHGDELNEAIKAAQNLGLSLQPSQMELVTQAQQLYQKAAPKLMIRDELRRAVEAADKVALEAAQKQMHAAQKEEGREFCKDEMRASNMMLKMFAFQDELGDHLGDTAKPSGSAGRVSKEALDVCHDMFTGGVFRKSMFDSGDIIEARLPNTASDPGSYAVCEILRAHRGRPKGKGQRLKEGKGDALGQSGEGAMYVNSFYTVTWSRGPRRGQQDRVLWRHCRTLLEGKLIEICGSAAQMAVTLRHYKWVRMFATWNPKYQDHSPVVTAHSADLERTIGDPSVRRRAKDKVVPKDRYAPTSTVGRKQSRVDLRDEALIMASTKRTPSEKADTSGSPACNVVRGIPRQARRAKEAKPERLAILGQLQYDRLLESERGLQEQRAKLARTQQRLKGGNSRPAWGGGSTGGGGWK